MADSVTPGASTALQALPELPAHYNPIRALPEADRNQLMDAILSHYENGASIYDLAEKLGVDNTTLYRNLKRYRPDDWKEIASARYESEIEDAEKELKAAGDALAVTRARERIAAARWRLERLDRKNYGQDAPQAAAAVQVNISLRREGATIAPHNDSITVDSKTEGA
jgi:transposase-like protein